MHKTAKLQNEVIKQKWSSKYVRLYLCESCIVSKKFEVNPRSGIYSKARISLKELLEDKKQNKTC